MTFSLDEFLGDDGDGDYTVDVPIKPRSLAKKHADLERLIQQAMGKSSGLAGDSELREMAEALQELERRIDEQSTVYTFRAVSRRRWRSLMAEHPPKKGHKEDGLDFNPETFPPAAIAACSVSPKLTLEQAKALEDDDTLSAGDFELLWSGVLAANLGVLADTPKSLIATAILRTNGASSTSAAPGASPAASS